MLFPFQGANALQATYGPPLDLLRYVSLTNMNWIVFHKLPTRLYSLLDLFASNIPFLPVVVVQIILGSLGLQKS